MAISFMEQFNAARRASIPLVSVRTPDITATLRTISSNKFNERAAMILWDSVRGVTAVNEPFGKQLIERICKQLSKQPADFADAVEMLKGAAYLPEGGILFMSNIHLFINDPYVVQGIWNLRDVLKANTRMLVLCDPFLKLPPVLAQDILVLDEPLPDAKQLEGIVKETYNAVSQPIPKVEICERATEILCGLTAFSAEQEAAVSMTKEGLDFDLLWERKRKVIEQTPGLSIHRGKEKFADIVGLDNAKLYHALRGKSGRKRRRGLVFIDEIDKHLAGFGAVGTGDTTTEMVGALLTYMQDIDAEGSLFLGVAGAGKTLLGRAISNEWGVPCINYDLAGMKGSLVGQSGENIRFANKVVSAVTGGYAYFVATCNRIENLPPELRRRFKSATFFFDLSTRAEKDKAWEYYANKYELKANLSLERPADPGWTPSEINNCCYNAHVLDISLEEAAKYIIPINESAGDEIKRLRATANNRFISASHPGAYKAPAGETPEEDPAMVVVAMIPGGKRKINPPVGGNGGKKDSMAN